MPGEKSRLVFSTDKTIPRQEQPARKVLPACMRPSQLRVTIRLDRKSRGGKSVTVIEGLVMSQKDRETLLKQLKGKLATGGTVRDDAFEIQGDHREALMTVLEKIGYRPKRSGG